MPSPVAHGMIALSVYALVNYRRTSTELLHRNNLVALALILCLSILPDIDFLLVVITGNELAHGGFSHSIVFAAMMCVLLRVAKVTVIPLTVCFLIILSHPMLDMCTIDGYYPGTKALLWPFTSARYSFNAYLGVFDSLDWADEKAFYSVATIYSVLKEFVVGCMVVVIVGLSRMLLCRRLKI